MISDIDTTVPTDDWDKYHLDTAITDFKVNVKESFPNIDGPVNATGDNINQLKENDFSSTIRENGIEVVKLSGAEFAGDVFNEDGNNPQFPNQLVTKAYVDWAISVAFPEPGPGPTWEEFVIDAVQPDLYWTFQETNTAGVVTVFDSSGNTYNGESTTFLGQQPSVVPSEPDRFSILSFHDDGRYYGATRSAAAPYDAFAGICAIGISLKSTNQGTSWGDGTILSIIGVSSDLWIGISNNSSEPENEGKVFVEVPGSSRVYGNASINGSDPHLIIVVINQTAGTVKIYFDGVLDADHVVSGMNMPAIGVSSVATNPPGRNGSLGGWLSDYFYLNDFISDSGASIIYDKWLNG